jgi:hypothetical protein
LVPLVCSSGATFPKSVETGAAVTRAIPFLLLSRTMPIAALSMPSWSGTQPLWREACRLPAPVSEREYIQSAAYLHPSLPSPLSLVTWSQALSIAIPACNPSNLGGPADIGLIAIQGRPHALRPWSPSRRGHKLTPLLPQPNGDVWAPVAPVEASLQPPVLIPIYPGTEGTAPPHLNAVRAQPATMPVLPPESAPFEIEPAAVRPQSVYFEAALQLASIDVAYGTSSSAWEVRAETSTVLPSFSAERHAPSIGLASSSHQDWWSAIPPVPAIGTVQPFSALHRLAWSLAACLPGPGLTDAPTPASPLV